MSSNGKDEVTRLAEACAGRWEGTTAADAALLDPEFRALVRAVGAVDPALAFDRDGRPAAIAAVRSALPLTERELLDAILEDHACEMAAVQEAMLQVVMAAAKRKR